MAVYPVALDLTGRPCLVIGGGAVAERKVEGLLEAGAGVTVVSPGLAPGLGALAEGGRVRHVARAYRDGDLAGCVLAFAATDDGAVNAAVAAEGRARGVLVNAADDPARCDFLLPAVLRRGVLTVAVSTGGASPALARVLRDALEASLGDEWTALAALAAAARRELHAAGVAVDAARWRDALGADVRGLLAAGRAADARRRLLDRLGAA